MYKNPAAKDRTASYPLNCSPFSNLVKLSLVFADMTLVDKYNKLQQEAEAREARMADLQASLVAAQEAESRVKAAEKATEEVLA